MSVKGKTIFITGGAGFIGSALGQRLADENKIIIYDNLRRDALRYTDIAEHDNVTFIQGDILDKAKLEVAAGDSQIVIHLAAVAGVTSYNRWPVETMKTNFIGTFNLLEVFAERGAELFVNFSTSEVYGPLIFGAREDDITSQGEASVPRWSYGVSKLAAEHIAFAFHRTRGLPVVSIRPFNIYGPRQIGEGAIPIFLLRALKDREILVTGDGNQIRAWCFIDDFVDGVLACLDNPERVTGQVINIGNPRGTITILGLVETVIRLTGSKSPIRFIPHPNQDIKLRVPSIEKAAELIGYRPKVGLEEGLKRTIPWYKERLELIIEDEHA